MDNPLDIVKQARSRRKIKFPDLNIHTSMQAQLTDPLEVAMKKGYNSYVRKKNASLTLKILSAIIIAVSIVISIADWFGYWQYPVARIICFNNMTVLFILGAINYYVEPKVYGSGTPFPPHGDSDIVLKSPGN